MITLENNPTNSSDGGIDLVVLMGSIVDPDFQDDSYPMMFEWAVEYLKLQSIPWVATGTLARLNGIYANIDLLSMDQESGNNTFNGENYTLSLSGAYN